MSRKVRLSNLYDRYEATVSLLKNLGWWTLRSGQYFHTLLIYTLPPPSLKHLSQLLSYLSNCELNTDWAPLKQTRHWKTQVDGVLTNTAYEENLEALGHIGDQFPIFFGIREISRLGWPQLEQRALIEQFVHTVFHATRAADHLHLNEYYHDVYKLRDALIDHHAGERLPVGRDTRTNLKEKQQRAEQIICGLRYPGESPNLASGKRGSFLEDPPFVPFIASSPDTDRTVQHNSKTLTRKASDKDHSGEQLDPPDIHWLPNPDGTFASKQQFQAQQKVRTTYLRNNVRSLADPNQLTLTAIVSYWRQLVGTKYQSLLALSLAALLTGIRRDRWLQLVSGNGRDLTKTNIVLSNQDSAILYRVIKGASNFGQEEIAYSEVMELPISKQLTSDLKQAITVQACKKDYPVRAFSKSSSGPSPTINRIANSGEALIRKQHLSASEMGLLAGKVPIQFQARNCYVSRDRERLNSQFFDLCTSFWANLQKHYLKPKEPLFALMKAYLSHDEKILSGDVSLGSQLGHLAVCSPPERFKAPTLMMMRPNEQQQIKEMVQAANLLELHLYWMQQYAFAQRPAGSASSSITHDDYRLHGDKDSAQFSETKLLKVPALIARQVKENLACRAMLVDNIYRCSHTLRNETGSRYNAWYFERSDLHNRCTVSPMTNSKALELAEQHWGYEPEVERPNISRHQCATLAHKQSGEVLADTWLGHHIDGWDPYAPESSLATTALDTLEELQVDYLSHIGFGLMRNPLS